MKEHQRHLDIVSWPPSLGSGRSSTFSSKLASFGKPSKCFVRIHDLACTMIYFFITYLAWRQQLQTLFRNAWKQNTQKWYMMSEQCNFSRSAGPSSWPRKLPWILYTHITRKKNKLGIVAQIDHHWMTSINWHIRLKKYSNMNVMLRQLYAFSLRDSRQE